MHSSGVVVPWKVSVLWSDISGGSDRMGADSFNILILWGLLETSSSEKKVANVYLMTFKDITPDVMFCLPGVKEVAVGISRP